MTWSWSHSQEAYNNLRINIRNLPVDELKEIYAKIQTFKLCVDIENLKNSYIHTHLLDEILYYDVFLPNNYYDDEIYYELLDCPQTNDFLSCHLNSIEEFTDLSEFIFDFASQLRECDDGGFNAYLDPFHDHKLSFDLQ